jgi:small subunit ribosomal protein S16
MLKIRLTRRGKKNKAFFRVVVAEHTSPIKGKFLENLGFFNPHTKEKEFKTDRIKYWIEKGAQCSDSVHNMLVSDGIVKGPKRAVKLKKKAASAEVPASQAEPASAKGSGEAKEEKEAEVAKSEPEKKEPASSADKKPAEVTEPKKEEKKTESASSADKDVKPEPEAEKKEEKKSDEKK